jgi:hypothetical protein
MRAKEFITEKVKDLHKNAKRSLPYGRQFDGADQYYDFYRLGIMAAGAPTNEAPTEGPAKDCPTAWAYSKADEEIINTAAKKLGFGNKLIVQKGSLEPKGTNTVSPVAKWK